MRLRARQVVEVSTIIGAVALIFAVLFFLLFDRSYRVLETAVKARAQAGARTIAIGVNFGLASRAVEDAQHFLAAYKKQHREAKGVAVFDAQGKLFAHVGAISRRSLAAGARKKGPNTELKGELAAAIVPVVAEEQTVGYVRYEESLAGVMRFRRAVAMMSVAASAVLFLVIIAAAFFSFRRILGALARLTEASRRARRGDLSTRVPVDGSDELTALSEQFNQMLSEIDSSRKQAQEQARLRREMELAERVQTSLLPQLDPYDGLSIAAEMLPADEVGGDYYDFIPTGDEQSCWLAIGDVSGHGLSAGLVMMMVQSSIATATGQNPKAGPSEILARVNRVVHGNVRGRWKTSQHMTLTLLHYAGAGRFVFAGAHEEMLVLRRAAGRVEVFPTRGAWIGAVADVSKVMPEAELELGPGDVLVLYTDGVTEALREHDGERFGLERLKDVVERASEKDPQEVVDDILSAVRDFTPLREDDQTVLVVQRRFEASGE